jgi:hypothetical protein
MTESLEELDQQRSSIFQEMVRLPDFRSGSITALPGDCHADDSDRHQRLGTANICSDESPDAHRHAQPRTGRYLG